MAEKLGTGAGKLDLTLQIGSTQYRTFGFNDASGNPLDISTWTFEFYIKAYAGDLEKILSLTLGNGISFVTYTDTSILVTITGAQATIDPQGEYYWELRRTDLNIPLLSGRVFFTYESA